ncbi:hypothetical protein [Streptomyces djakartensis]|uniref:Uncharacterized protein n=1 Tax=Streptomyces djakartensis TaxID=68193 RepID=A0ABQ3ACY2_9ACTN|nr:hypothetical protein [Streptomyces djakartensis]GGY45583.1 hypothetical protein GCM10010384_60330 [Streptomyces djakartensis]
MSESGRALLVQRVGRLLCWSLAAGMLTAAADLVLDPRAAWWRSLWLLPWYLTGLSVLAWAVLRARQKAAQRPDEEDVSPERWEQAA